MERRGRAGSLRRRAERERTRDERGAALVEFALMLPLLIILLLGVVSAGVAYNHQLSLTHAAREAGRYAATLPVSNFDDQLDPLEAWLDEVAARAVDDATGSLAVGSPGRSICVAYVHPDGVAAIDSTKRRVEDTTGVTYADGLMCFPDGRPDAERRVQVLVAREADFNVLVFSTTLSLDSEAVSRFEAGLGF